MTLKPSNQTNLYGLDFYFQDFINLFNKNKLPNKILLSGYKGIGKSTLAYHLINYVLSKDEDYSYDFKNNKINSDNKSFEILDWPKSETFCLGNQKKLIFSDNYTENYFNCNLKEKNKLTKLYWGKL